MKLFFKHQEEIVPCHMRLHDNDLIWTITEAIIDTHNTSVKKLILKSCEYSRYYLYWIYVSSIELKADILKKHSLDPIRTEQCV